MKKSKKQKNIFWLKYHELEAKDSSFSLNSELEKRGMVARTFFKHCEAKIENIQFKYLKSYGEMLGLTWNDLENEVNKNLN